MQRGANPSDGRLREFRGQEGGKIDAFSLEGRRDALVGKKGKGPRKNLGRRNLGLRRSDRFSVNLGQEVGQTTGD